MNSAIFPLLNCLDYPLKYPNPDPEASTYSFVNF